MYAEMVVCMYAELGAFPSSQAGPGPWPWDAPETLPDLPGWILDQNTEKKLKHDPLLLNNKIALFLKRYTSEKMRIDLGA